MNKIITLIFLLMPSLGVWGENKLTLSLDDAIIRACSHSVDGAVALNSLRSAYWQWRAYRADLLPEVGFKATLPAFARQYSPYMNENGSYSFVRNNYLQFSGELSVSQNIWLTGGQISFSTSLDYLRQLGTGAYNRFMSVPVAVTLTQPVFGVNNVRWSRRIEPVRYAEAKAEFISATQDVALTAINYYFQLLMARENMEIATQNLENATRLYTIAKEKRNMGKISGNDLLQMELSQLNAEAEYTECESDLRSSMFQFRSFLDFDEDAELEVVVPEEIPAIEIPYNVALEKAMANNKHAHNMMRRRLEADYEVAKARSGSRSINLYAQFGYAGTGHDIAGGYDPLRPNQVVEVGFNIPILDWGKNRGKVKMAESNRQVVESRLKRENMDFSRNLFVLVERFANQSKQLKISLRADEIAARRYAVNMETFVIGKISTLDLNDARVKKDEARREYITQLYRYWQYYYQIRSITLWDFVSGRELEADFEKLLR